MIVVVVTIVVVEVLTGIIVVVEVLTGIVVTTLCVVIVGRDEAARILSIVISNDIFIKIKQRKRFSKYMDFEHDKLTSFYRTSIIIRFE